jgi:hypothetical protein
VRRSERYSRLRTFREYPYFVIITTEWSSHIGMRIAAKAIQSVTRPSVADVSFGRSPGDNLSSYRLCFKLCNCWLRSDAADMSLDVPSFG